ncbi:MAG: PspA/IM30 family protein [Hyphomicrobium sp.]
MLKTLTTLLRGAVAEAEEAVFDANAIRVLEQQLRDAAGSLEHCKRELACAMAHQASEGRAVAALAARIAELELSAKQALVAGREDLAEDAATVIAANEDERLERHAAVGRFDTDIRRLKQIAEDGRRRLMDLRRGLEMARAQDALRRAGANGRRALASGSGALREAEGTLAKIRELQARDDDVSAALDELERHGSARDLSERFETAGFGTRPRTDPADVLARMKSSAAAAAKPEVAGSEKADAL